MGIKKFDLDTVFRFDDNIRKILNIPEVEKIDCNEEYWHYVILDRHKKYNKERRYMISTYGRVYDVKNQNIVHDYPWGSNSLGESYRSVLLNFSECQIRYSVHRLVALAFIEVDEDRPFVNHIDGHPSHNYLWNLEWVNNSENVLHAVKIGLKKDKLGEQRSNALWSDEEIHLICQMMEEGHKATYIYHTLGEILKDPKVEYERVRTLYKHIIKRTHWTHISSQYDIDFTRFNYAKEKGSVSKKKNQTK